MQKAHFIIVGSGWRALYYVRIAKALPDYFHLDALLCRTKEKAERLASEYDIYTTTSIDECKALNPDFVVVAVNKAGIADVSIEWMNYGFTVLCETPASLDLDMLKTLWETHKNGGKLVVAEQYIYYPEIAAKINLLKTGIIGEPYAINSSLAHEYHGASLIRAFLNEKISTGFKISAKTYSFPTKETLTRYEQFTDGRIADKKRTIATIEFDDGKVAFYDFNSEQYRSPIRHNTFKIQGCNGEIINDSVYYLDESNMPKQSEITYDISTIKNDSDNPNFQTIREYNSIDFENMKLYEARFGKCNLGQDETAIATAMYNAYYYSKNTKNEYYTLEEALTDSYMAILLSKAEQKNTVIQSEKMPWM